MGRKNKKYTKDLHQQAYDRLTAMLSFGESKREAAKADEMQDKIFSVNTFKTYWKHIKYFLRSREELERRREMLEMLLFPTMEQVQELGIIVSLRDGIENGFIAFCFRENNKKERHLSMSFSRNSKRRSGRSPALPYPPIRESDYIQLVQNRFAIPCDQLCISKCMGSVCKTYFSPARKSLELIFSIELRFSPKLLTLPCPLL